MKKAIMYGAGNIGRGFIGQLFSESGYEVVFIDVNAEIIKKLNEDRNYPVRILTGESSLEILVKGVRGVDGRDTAKVAEEISDADIMATAVGVNILPRIAALLAEGMKLRWSKGNMAPLNIIICENMLDANHYLADLIRQNLDDSGKDSFNSLIGLVEASIGRMVPVMTPAMQEGNILRICVEEYGELPVDRDGFKGEIPDIKKMKPSSPFDFYIQRKLFIHNMGHALTAYLGNLKGYEYIWEAVGDSRIRSTALRAMQNSAAALSKKHGIDAEEILEHANDLIRRFGNKQLGDTVKRVGNDTRRKLSPHDRLIGAARLCMEYGIIPADICLGVAAAMKFSSQTAGVSDEVQKILADEGPEAVLEKICELTKESPLWSMILDFYRRLDRGDDLYDLL